MALGKDKSNPLTDDSLLKTIWSSIHHLLTNEVLTILGQTTTGKEISNPFMAEAYCCMFIDDKVSAVKSKFSASNDVTRLQALVDRKKVVITEAAIKDILHLDDAEGVDCLPNEEIFTELARMGYEKPSTKLTFYKAFFSIQWKFLIHTILQLISAKRTSWNEFSSAIASAVICLSTGRKFNFSKYTHVDSSSKFYMYPRFIQLIIQNQLGELSTHTIKYTSPGLTQKVFANMRRVGKRFSGVEMPLFKGMLVAGEPKEQGDAEEQVQDNVDDAAQGADTTVSGDDVQDQSIPSPTPPTPPPQQPQDLPSTSQVQSPLPQPQSPPPAQPQGADFPMSLLQETLDACAALTRRVEHLEHDKVAQDLEIIKLKTRVKKLERANKVKALKIRRLKKVAGDEHVKGRQAEIYQIDMDHASKVLSMQEDEPKVQEVVDVVTTAKKLQRDPKEKSTAEIPAETKSMDKGKGIMDIDWSVAIDHVKQKAKEDSYVQRYQVMKKRPQTEAQARRNMIMYLKNVVGFRLDYFKGMSYDDIPKKRKLNPEDEDLKQHLEIVSDEDDDVYTEATLLARKVLVVDYQIIQLNNKPRYKIIRADGTHQLYVSFITLLKNFDREDLESL
uniref:Synaptobrevin, longin-like domain protein n=1 Tax=Tanacetum cinerariifolium TaxID=118510 RepID=A0A6L2JF68_TANCI|nr:hypothetical protein [Tanacetum cinerariifolium]